MNPAEIIVREMQSASRFQILQFLRKSVRQARKPSHLHSHGQILPLDIAGRNVVGIRIAKPDLGYTLRDRTWGVLPFAVMLTIVAKELDELREIRIQPKRIRHSGLIRVISVRGELHAVR